MIYKNKLRRTLTLYFTLLFTGVILGQSQIQFKHLGVDKGLSNGRITDITQDSIGFIWVASKNGLNRFDGAKVKVFNIDNSDISSNDISALTIDQKGRFWIGTIGGGVNLYNPVKDKFIHYKNNSESNNSLSSNIVHTIVEDSKGNIWIGTENGLNLFVESSHSFKSYTADNANSNAISHNSVWAIFEQEKGDIWIGTYGGGLNKFDPKTERFERVLSGFKNDKELPFEFINSISEINSNELLIGTNGNGLIRFNLETKSSKNVLKNTLFKDVSIIRNVWKDDKHGNYWVGTDGVGILKIEGINSAKIKIENFVNDNRLSSSLSNNTVNAFFEDNQSNIWIGTAWKGVNIIEKSSNDLSFFYSDFEGINSSPILSIFKSENKLWMGSDGKGLSILNINSQKIKIYNKAFSTSIKADFVQSITPKNEKEYWIGTFANGLILFNDQTGETEQYKRETKNDYSLPYNDVRDVIPLKYGDAWVGTWGGGLSFFDFKIKKFKNYRHSNSDSNSICSDNVLSILLNNDGTIWVGTFGGGLDLFDPKTEKFTHHVVDEKSPKSIGSNYIFSLLKDGRDNLWIGTKDGLQYFDTYTKTFEKIKIGNNSNSNTVVGLLSDHKDDIWLSTKEGIYKFDRISKRVEALPNVLDEFHINSVFKDIDGILYFGSVDKVISFDPKIVTFKNYDSPVIITDFKLFNEDVNVGDNNVLKRHITYEKDLVLKYDEDVITFDFATFNYPFSNKEHFAIKMEGFDKGWRTIGNQRSATFTNLSPGEYTFMVRGLSTSSKQNGRNTASVNIIITSPFWRTWWAYFLYAVLIVLILLAYKKYTFRLIHIKNELKLERIQREQEDKLHQLKQRFFTNISHEIRTPLTLLMGPLNKMFKIGNLDANQQKQLSLIKSSANRLLNLVNELLSFRKLETGHVKLKVTESNIVEFVHEIFLSYTQQAKNKEIKYSFNTNEEVMPIWFDTIQLEKAIYNLLSNAFKFTESGDAIIVEIDQKDSFVTISVKDSGKGISKTKLPNVFKRFYQNENADNIKNIGFGIGLSITKDIVELHSGVVDVKSDINEGSDFMIKIPKGNNHFKKDELIYEPVNHDELRNYSNEVSENEDKEFDFAQEFRGSSILVVEDNIHIRKYLSELLVENYVVFDAANGKEGLEKAFDIVPDLVISDVMMPVMDGITFCSNLKTDIRTSHIPVILLTARTLINERIEGYETGADEYLTKPFNESILKVRINNLLQGRKMLRDLFLKEKLVNPKEITLNSPDEEFLVKLVELLEHNIDNSEFNIDQLSKDIGMSHSNVYKKVKALTGMTIIGFLKDFRLKRAAQLLIQEKISIVEVCFKVGYTDRRHFSQEFKKKFGKSPTDYIKNHLDKNLKHNSN